MSKRKLLLTAVSSILIGLTPSTTKLFAQDKGENLSSNVVLELIPVKSSKSKSKDCLELGNECLVPLGNKGIVLKDFVFEKTTKGQPGVKVHLDEKEDKTLEKLTKKYEGSRMALVYNGKVLVAPVIKEKITSNDFVLTFSNHKNFENFIKEIN